MFHALPNSVRHALVHGYRWAVFIAILLLVHDAHRAYLRSETGVTLAALDPASLAGLYPEGFQLGEHRPEARSIEVVDRDGTPIGEVIQSAPEADDVIGYAGPSNTLIPFDADGRILGMRVLRSADTAEHLQTVLRDRAFMERFNGRTWKEAARSTDVDAVSGATLTSLAIAEGVLLRLSGDKPSLRFPRPLTLEETMSVFTNAASLREPSAVRTGRAVVDEAGRILGIVVRTSPEADAVIGYQGPTDTLLALDADASTVKGIRLRSSYDNQPYVRYVTEDRYFMERFNGKRVDELAEIDLDDTGVEGVSGATMTSVAVAEGVLLAARGIVHARSAPNPSRAIRVRGRDIGTAALILATLAFALSPWKKNRRLRVAFRVVLIGYLGFINGDMLAQGLLVGWARNGPPWQLAPGLVLLVGVALIAPLTSHKQVYCQHICPHGAAQELIHRRFRFSFQPPRRLIPWLKALPGLFLAWVILVSMRHLPFGLTAIEPFDAYLIQIAGWGTITVAVVGLVAAFFVPMAYCRYGCPTGAMLNFLRRRQTGDHLTRTDAAAAALLLLAVLLRVA